MDGIRTVYIVTPSADNRADLVAGGIDACKAAGVTHVVVVSVPAVVAAGELIFKTQFTKIEAKVAASGLKSTILRLPMFMENQWANQGSIKGQGKIYGPADGSKPVSLLSVGDAGEASAVVLAAPAEHAGKTYTLAAEATSFNKIAAAFSTATGKDVGYVRWHCDVPRWGWLAVVAALSMAGVVVVLLVLGVASTVATPM